MSGVAGQARSSGHTCESTLDPSAKLRLSGMGGSTSAEEKEMTGVGPLVLSLVEV